MTVKEGSILQEDENISNTSFTDLPHGHSDIILFEIILVPLILGGLVSNLLVFAAIVSSKKLHGAFNSLLLNLCISDFLCAVSAGLFYVNLVRSEKYDEEYTFVACMILFGSSSVFVNVSIFTIAVISLERRSAIIHPLRHKAMLRSINTVTVNTSIWVLAVVTNFPTLWFLISSKRDKVKCRSSTEHILCMNVFTNREIEGWLALLDLVTFYIIPMLIILESSLTIIRRLWFTKSHEKCTNLALLRSRRRISRILFSVIIAFNVSWLPWAIYLGSLFTQQASTLDSRAFLSTVVLLAFNATVNPLLYAIQSQRFRKEIKRLILRRNIK